MRVATLLSMVRKAISYAELETAQFGSVNQDQRHMRDVPVKFKDGRIVTEANVTEFIRERVCLHHQSWIIGPLVCVATEMQREIKHNFDGGTVRGYYGCSHCGMGANHSSHHRGRK